MISKIDPKRIIFSADIQRLCARPYPGHPHGCPNFGRKVGCPPRQLVINQVLDFSRPIYVIWTELNLAAWVRRMAKLHSKLKTYAQQVNLRYWQPTMRSQLNSLVSRAIQGGLIEIAVDPEAHGVNVSALMQLIGVKLEWPPKTFVRKVVLAGFKYK
jgi:predicted metal-binding protein